LLRGGNESVLKGRAARNIFAARRVRRAKTVFQGEMPMQRVFAIPRVPVSLGDMSLAPKRGDSRRLLRDAGDRCLRLLRRFVDFMASGGAMS